MVMLLGTDYELKTDRELMIHIAGRVDALEDRMKGTVIRLSQKQLYTVVGVVLGAFGVGTGAF